MKYSQMKVFLRNPLSFWRHFEKEERCLFYHPQKKETVLGAKRLRKFEPGESGNDACYIFSTKTFFDFVKDAKWEGFGNENVAYAYYLVVRDGEQTLYYTGDTVSVQDVEIERFHHSVQYSRDDFEDFQTLFHTVKEAISRGVADKVVISREVRIGCQETIRVESVLLNLLQQNTNSFVFAYHKDGKTFLGATPEVLVQKKGKEITTYALAGTLARRDGDEGALRQSLLRDEKNLHEHQIVIDAIVGVIDQWVEELKVEPTQILTLKNLFHLQTEIKGRSKGATLEELALALHPTPALGGNPSKVALELIRAHEKHERGLYAAPIGLMDANGDGVFVAGIRSALIIGDTAYACVGSGIVKQSDCESEYRETENKFKTILESL